jgi:uncharacterized OB-fold protein
MSPSGQAPELPVALPIGPEGDVDLPYWEGLRQGLLRLQCCADCGQWIWAPSWVCPACHAFDPPWRDVEPKGIVHSWTRTRQAFPASQEFKDHVPYTIVLVELSGAGLRRVLGLGVGFDEHPRIGEQVHGVVQPASELTGGWPVMRWRRGPVPEGTA